MDVRHVNKNLPKILWYDGCVRVVGTEDGIDCQCNATTSITIGPGVTVKNGATVTFKAPIVNLQPGFHAESGSTVRIKQE